jgi:hypothetical protein
LDQLDCLLDQSVRATFVGSTIAMLRRAAMVRTTSHTSLAQVAWINGWSNLHGSTTGAICVGHLLEQLAHAWINLGANTGSILELNGASAQCILIGFP